ncbi:hypothetical protein [Hydrogenophaga sp.]|uniref:hypothetical protein n=1 Tax=Hydrogenophaga sp. TaxID=1904254 RepID=UPI00271C6B42|nr:hypothetical protein [Hydrogenophaga sp.]MDO9434727.1 hypothetical protein [Hydrogenophaga sp.]
MTALLFKLRQHLNPLGSSTKSTDPAAARNSVTQLLAEERRISLTGAHHGKKRGVESTRSEGGRVTQEVRRVLSAAKTHLAEVLEGMLSGNVDAQLAPVAVAEVLGPLGARLAREAAQAEKDEARAHKHLVPTSIKVPGPQDFIADICGALLLKPLKELSDADIHALHALLPKDPLVAQRAHLSSKAQHKLENMRADVAAVPKSDVEVVMQQLAFSVKADILLRMMARSKSSDTDPSGPRSLHRYDVDKLHAEDLRHVYDLASHLIEETRANAPRQAPLPGTRFWLEDLEDIVSDVEYREAQIAKRKPGAEKLARAGITRQNKKDPLKLEILQKELEFLIELRKLPKPEHVDLLARVVAQRKKLDREITKAIIDRPRALKAGKLSNTKLVAYQQAIMAAPYKPKALLDAQKIIQVQIGQRKTAAKDAFETALRVFVNSDAATAMDALLLSAAQVQAASSEFKELGETLSRNDMFKWIGEVLLQEAKRVPGDRSGLTRLQDYLTKGDGKVLRDVLLTSQIPRMKFTFGYLDMLNNAVNFIMPVEPSARHVKRVDDFARTAIPSLMRNLHLRLKEGAWPRQFVDMAPDVAKAKEAVERALEGSLDGTDPTPVRSLIGHVDLLLRLTVDRKELMQLKGLINSLKRNADGNDAKAIEMLSARVAQALAIHQKT